MKQTMVKTAAQRQRAYILRKKFRLAEAAAAELAARNGCNNKSNENEAAHNGKIRDESKEALEAILNSNSNKIQRDSLKSEMDEFSSDTCVKVTEQNGFELGLEAEKILGTLYSHGRRIFLVQFKGMEFAEFVPANVAHMKIPQMIIKFYEEHLSWSSENEE